ncbi:MAG TPA: hypothetical protein VFN57_14525 [Thermomicrobiaceae bacterium]|nr:hypothetical protein [Thermomicrobiaceae bacterium]
MKRDEYQQDSEQNTERAAQAGARRWDPGIRVFNPEEITVDVPPGTTVVDRVGDEIGTVRAVYTPIGLDVFNADPYNAFIYVDRPGLAADLFIPARFIGHVGNGQVRMTITKGEMRGLDWQKPDWIRA